MKKREKVLLLGWDAADWKVINPLIDEGKMPNLTRLVEQGVMGNIATLQPVLSPMLWSSIATGKRPYKHGIHGFSEPDPVTGGIRPVTNLSRKTKAVWNILNQNDLNTITIGWWPSNPAEPLSKGVMVSNDYQISVGKDRKSWPMKKGTVHPQRLEKELKGLRFHQSELNEEDLFAFMPGLKGLTQEELDKASKDPRVQSLAKIIADCTSIHSAATALMQNEPWDLMSVYYDAIDHFGHAFMKFHPPQRDHISDWDYRLFNYCVEAGYIYHDMLLGTLMDLAGEDTTIILISDHGFHPDDLRPAVLPREPAGPAAEHRQFGIFVAKGPGIKKDERVHGAGLLDICPTLLHLFDLPIGDDMDGKVLTDIYEQPPGEIASVNSWDEVPGDDGMHPPDRQISADDSKAALEQLVALGYIDKPDEDNSAAIEKTVRELDYNLSQAYIDGGIYTEAVTILERLYRKWPLEHRFGFKLAVCYQNQDRPSDLRRIVEQVIKNRIQEAKEAGEELKSFKLDTEEGREKEQLRINGMSEVEQQQLYLDRTELIAKSRPNLFSLRYLEACCDFAEKKYEDALGKLGYIDTAFGARRNALTLRGDVFQKLKRWSDSSAAYEEALEMDQENPGPLSGLARTALAQKDFNACISYSKASVGLLFFQPRVHYMQGVAHYRLGHWRAAEQCFKQCVHQAPLFSAAYRMLGEIARFYKNEPREIAFYKKQVTDARKRLREIGTEKFSELANSDYSRLTDSEQSRPMPKLKIRPAALENVQDTEIVTIVSGLPRSGTSLMMQILDAAGISLFTDGNREADDSNQKGYYEHDKVAGLIQSSDKSWLRDARGKALKVVAPLLAGLPLKVFGAEKNKVNQDIHYRVIYMERDMEEILNSQTKMLERLDKQTEVTEKNANVAKAYQQQVRNAKSWICGRGISAMSVDYSLLVHQPEKMLPEIAAFLGCEDKLKAMQSCIDPALHRERKN